MCNGKEHKQKPEIHTLNGRKTEECVNRGKIILKQRETRAIQTHTDTLRANEGIRHSWGTRHGLN